MLLGWRVAKRRNELGLTQLDLATAVGLSRSSIANIESGRQELSVAVAVDISRILDTPVGALLGEEPRAPLPQTWIEQGWRVRCELCGPVGFAVDHEAARELRTSHLRHLHLDHPNGDPR